MGLGERGLIWILLSRLFVVWIIGGILLVSWTVQVVVGWLAACRVRQERGGKEGVAGEGRAG